MPTPLTLYCKRVLVLRQGRLWIQENWTLQHTLFSIKREYSKFSVSVHSCLPRIHVLGILGSTCAMRSVTFSDLSYFYLTVLRERVGHLILILERRIPYAVRGIRCHGTKSTTTCSVVRQWTRALYCFIYLWDCLASCTLYNISWSNGPTLVLIRMSTLVLVFAPNGRSL